MMKPAELFKRFQDMYGKDNPVRDIKQVWDTRQILIPCLILIRTISTEQHCKEQSLLQFNTLGTINSFMNYDCK